MNSLGELPGSAALTWLAWPAETEQIPFGILVSGPLVVGNS